MLSILAVKLLFADSYNRCILRDLLGNAGFELIEAEIGSKMRWLRS
jgi:hypothetical protein